MEAPGRNPPPATAWASAPEAPALRREEVHVWRAVLRHAASLVTEFWPLLSEDERARAARFHFRKDSDFYVATRGMLRSVLARYLRRAPAELRFTYNPFGKPALAPEQGEAGLRFNLSHSQGLALLAVACGREVGIDVEWVGHTLADEEIAARFFSRPEVEALRALPTEARPRAFFNCWTRKEAYIKARGEGLSFPLDQFQVSLRPGEPAALLETAGDAAEARRWSMLELSPGEGYAAALVVEGHRWSPRLWRWP